MLTPFHHDSGGGQPPPLGRVTARAKPVPEVPPTYPGKHARSISASSGSCATTHGMAELARATKSLSKYR